MSKTTITISGDIDNADALFSAFTGFESMVKQPYSGYELTYPSYQSANDAMDTAWRNLKSEYKDDCREGYTYVLRNKGNRIYFIAFHNAISKLNQI
jgi:hypothetical protein